MTKGILKSSVFQIIIFFLLTFFCLSGNSLAGGDALDTSGTRTTTNSGTGSNNSITLQKPFSDKDGEATINTKDGAISIIEQYVSKIFLFGSGFVMLVAVIWIIIGGYEIMFRGSFAGSIEEGKQKITQALLGIVLLLLSALILHFVNPGFFTLNGGSAVKTTDGDGFEYEGDVNINPEVEGAV